jgi:protocatechuate 3,4-dioxygenase beta subunit
MERKSFIQKGVGFLGMAILAPSILGGNQAEACDAANSETAGPFPTLTPSSLVRTNIIGTRTGVAFTININVFNANGCAALQGVVVDIWHCDKDGYYSQYGGTSMQTVDFTAQDFLRGRQITNSSGGVSFTSIFPGWYTSRATHIHVHIYDTNGNTLSISQIAFPEGTGCAVELVNASTANGYSKGLTGYTYNSTDNVFTDGTATQMSVITGSVSAGYVLNWDAYVNSGSAGVDAKSLKQFQIRQNYPNPCYEFSNVPVVLRIPSDVTIQIFSTDGKLISTKELGSLTSGEHNIPLSIDKLTSGKYIYKVVINNFDGTFNQSKLFVKQ